jgi:hypothetical protein
VAVTHRVDPTRNPVQASSSNPMQDGRRSKSEGQQLLPCDDAVLLAGELPSL